MTKQIFSGALLAAILPLGVLPAAAQAHHETPAGSAAAVATATVGTATAGTLTVSDAYARSTNPSVGAAFMTIANTGAADCTLTAVTSDSIESPELHTNREEGGVMKMVEIENITVPAGGSHELARGGDHIMLMKPKAPIKEGQDIALTLDFGTCGKLPLTVKVDNAAGPAPGKGADHGAMDHGKMDHGAMDHGNHKPTP